MANDELDYKRLMNDGEHMLVELDDWVRSPDGGQFKQVWGLTRLRTSKDTLGADIKGDANYYFIVGTGSNAFIAAGCRVHFLTMCRERPVYPDVYCPE